MAPSFSKHAIICGAIDYYCLVCENRFETKDITSKHILTTSHTENLEETSYEVSEDCIRKIKLWYFCEFCNLLLKTKAKVKLHVTEQKHITNKVSQCLKRYDDAIVAFDEVCINKEAWDGLCDGTCVICNCEYDNELEHLKNPMHNITLIQSHIEFDNKNIYRLVDESSFHCVTCNSLIALPVNNHFDSLEHRTVYERCQQLASEILDSYQKKELGNNKNNNKNNNQATVVHENVQPVEIKEIEIFSPKGKNKTPKKSTPMELSKLFLNINKKKNTKVFNIKKNEKVICKILKANKFITRDEKGSTWCILCDWVMDDFKIDSHINSVHHRNILKLHELRTEKISNTYLKDDKEKEFNSLLDTKLLNNNDITKPKSTSTKLLDSLHNVEENNNAQAEQSTKTLTSPKLLNKTEEHLSNPKESATESKSYNKDQDERSNEPDLPDNRFKILDSIQTFQENDIKINFETNSAKCKRCTLNIDFNYDFINKHIDEHKKANTNCTKILDSVKTFEENNVDINFDMNIAKCKKCQTNIDFNYDSIEEHISKHKQQLPDREEVKCEDQTIDVQSDYAKRNNLKPVPGEKVVFCEKCNKHIPFSLNNMKEHLNGNTHNSREIEKNKEKKIKLQTVPLDTFVRSVMCIRNGIFIDDIINGELCINRHSNFFVARIPKTKKYKCFYCNVSLSESETEDHIQSKKHLEHISHVDVVTNVEDEFIRQIRQQHYHCGFCNQMFDSWQDMESHLKTVTHREAKIFAKWRLEEYSTVAEMKPLTQERHFSFRVFKNV